MDRNRPESQIATVIRRLTWPQMTFHNPFFGNALRVFLTVAIETSLRRMNWTDGGRPDRPANPADSAAIFRATVA